MGTVLSKADKPAMSVSQDTTVLDAVALMVEKRVGAVIVLQDGRASGIFSERDVMSKIVLGRLDAASTPVAQVMTSPVLTAPAELDEVAAMSLMLEKHIRHLPVVDSEGRVIGMLSIRHLMQRVIEELRDEVEALDAYMSYDGAVG